MVAVKKCLGDTWEIVIDFPYIMFNYNGSAEVRMNTMDLKELF